MTDTVILRMASNRSLSSILSDLPPETIMTAHPLDTEFSEGMKTIYDAIHPEVEEDYVPSHLTPFVRRSFSRVRQ